MPSIEDYCSTSWVSEMPFFSRVLPRDRFELIFWLLHLSHQEEGIQVRRIDKVKPLLDMLLARYQASYKPSRAISVDETMVGFRGRFGPKQYMPKKPVKYGIKAFTMADSEEGYVLNVLPYTGSDTLITANNEFDHLPQPARVVLDLVDPYLDKGHHIYTDRYYTSIPLANTLYGHKTAFTGTSNQMRVGLPEEIRHPPLRLRDNEVKAFRNNHLLALEWRAAKKKKSLVMISTEDSACEVTVTSRATNRETTKPKVVDHYNWSMNGVDRADQHTVYYSFIRRSRKWWRKLFFWLVEVTMVNSYILYKRTTPRPLPHLAYRRLVIQSLATRHIMAAPSRRNPGRPRKRPLDISTGDMDRLNGRTHVLGKRKEPHECAVCSRPVLGKRHRTLYFCKTCSS